ncbi:MAG: ATP-binding protein [Halofilum sp. (in: g-proteobacteria)]
MTRTLPDYDFDHPVFHPDRLRLRTPAMDRLGEDLHRWLWTGATGGLILGAARAGKTTAVRVLSPEVHWRDQTHVPTYYVSIPLRDQRTVTSVFRHLCWAAELRVSNADRADHLSDRFVHYLLDQATVHACRYAILIVDEMQRLMPQQYGAFAEIHDRLLLLDIRLVVFFVGNDQECSELLETIESPRYAHIRGRFFMHRVLFRGLRSRRDVEACLAEYDRLRYPAEGPTYTEYFLPAAYAYGWRLTALASDLWRAFRAHQRAYSIDSWGMQYFTATANTLLTDFLPRLGVEEFDDALAREGIALSGLLPDVVRPVR